MTADGLGILKRKLKLLEGHAGLNDGFSVACIPDPSREFAGEVKGGKMFSSETDLDSAIATLKHESIEYIVAQPVIPYKELLNDFLRRFKREAHKEMEMAVERLAR